MKKDKNYRERKIRNDQEQGGKGNDISDKRKKKKEVWRRQRTR